MSWSVYTDLTDERKGPATELVLSGTARDLVREIPLDQKTRGTIADMGDGLGQRHVSGMELIVRLMSMHFAHLDDEEASRQMMELYSFRRKPGETMDAYIARYTVTSHRVASINGVAMGPGQRAWHLLVGAGIQASAMWQFLLTLRGQLPTDDNQFQQVVEMMRRYGHLVENPGYSHGRHFPWLALFLSSTLAAEEAQPPRLPVRRHRALLSQSLSNRHSTTLPTTATPATRSQTASTTITLIRIQPTQI